MAATTRCLPKGAARAERDLDRDPGEAAALLEPLHDGRRPGYAQRFPSEQPAGVLTRFRVPPAVVYALARDPDETLVELLELHPR